MAVGAVARCLLGARRRRRHDGVRPASGGVVSPRSEGPLKTVGKYWFGATVFVALAISALFALVISPPDADQGDVVRLLYLHVPTIWIAYLAFFVTGVASLLWLIPRTRRTEWDLLAGASAEVGVIFTGITLVVGSVLGRPTWRTHWVWDARLTGTAILVLLSFGYLSLLRSG